MSPSSPTGRRTRGSLAKLWRRRSSAEGATVVLGARRVERIQALAEKLTRSVGKALAVATDVTQCDQVKKLVDAAVQTYGRIDVMLNNNEILFRPTRQEY